MNPRVAALQHIFEMLFGGKQAPYAKQPQRRPLQRASSGLQVRPPAYGQQQSQKVTPQRHSQPFSPQNTLNPTGYGKSTLNQNISPQWSEMMDYSFMPQQPQPNRWMMDDGLRASNPWQSLQGGGQVNPQDYGFLPRLRR